MNLETVIKTWAILEDNEYAYRHISDAEIQDGKIIFRIDNDELNSINISKLFVFLFREIMALRGRIVCIENHMRNPNL